MIIMKLSGIRGRGKRPVLATHPNTIVSTQAKMAGGMFSSWASAMPLRRTNVSFSVTSKHFCGDLRESQVRNNRGLIKVKPGRANGIECPAEKKQPELVVFESVPELFPVKVLLSGSGGVDGKPSLDECLF